MDRCLSVELLFTRVPIAKTVAPDTYQGIIMCSTKEFLNSVPTKMGTNVQTPIVCHYGNLIDTLQNVFPEYGEKIEQFIRNRLKKKCNKLKYVLITDEGSFDKIVQDYSEEIMERNQSNDPEETIECTGCILYIEYIGQQNSFSHAGFSIFVYENDVIEVETIVGDVYGLVDIPEEDYYNPKKYVFRKTI